MIKANNFTYKVSRNNNHNLCYISTAQHFTHNLTPKCATITYVANTERQEIKVCTKPIRSY